MAGGTEYYAPLGQPVLELEGGGIVAPGSTVKLTTEQVKANKEHIESGNLVKMEGGDK